MNTSQKDPNNPVMDEVDDLTRFLDEDFATDEVDLFEFTSGEEDSPLTQLKTIILGLDWEITDEALQDLADEIEHIRNLEQFKHDKVSQVYAQALDKIGNYVLTEGAYAHPNSIKLLMTLFYDFEKITSSEHITGAEITALLKSDVRKFKILQYQIAQKHGSADSGATAVATAELPITDNKTLLDIHAALLELDWEVSDIGLKEMADQLAILKDQFANNKYIQIVIRGLSTLNKYIDEERARTHPEAFTLLHHFFEALETLVDDKDLDEEKTQKILINCVNRLNNLKTLITQTPQELDADAITPVSETVEEDKSVIQEPAEASLTEEKAEATLEEQIAARRLAADLPKDDKEDEYVDELDVVLPVDGSGEVAPALFDSEEDRGFAEPSGDEEAPSEELEEKLQFFFGDDEDVPAPPPEVEIDDESVAEEATELPEEVSTLQGPAFTPPTKEEDEYEDELDVVLPVDGSGEVAPALFDSEEESGFGASDKEVEAPLEELEENLLSFFGSDEETFKPEALEEAAAQKKIADNELAATALKEKEEEDEILSVAPALAGEPDERGFSADEDDVEPPPEGLEEKLEFFFGEDESQKPEAVSFEEKVIEEVPEALFEEEVESPGPDATVLEEYVTEEAPEKALFEEEDEEEFLLTPALAADEDEDIFGMAPAETLGAISTPEDYTMAIEKLRSEFQEREQVLMDEIASLKQEIESLRS